MILHLWLPGCSIFLLSSQESYAMLQKYGLSVPQEESEKVDTMRYAWEKLLFLGTEVQNELVSLQPTFRDDLGSNVDTFLAECQRFYINYEMVKEKRSEKMQDISAHVCTYLSLRQECSHLQYWTNYPLSYLF